MEKTSLTWINLRQNLASIHVIKIPPLKYAWVVWRKNQLEIGIPKDKYDNLASKEQQPLHNLENNKKIFVKGAD